MWPTNSIKEKSCTTRISFSFPLLQNWCRNLNWNLCPRLKSPTNEEIAPIPRSETNSLLKFFARSSIAYLCLSLGHLNPKTHNRMETESVHRTRSKKSSISASELRITCNAPSSEVMHLANDPMACQAWQGLHNHHWSWGNAGETQPSMIKHICATWSQRWRRRSIGLASSPKSGRRSTNRGRM